LGGAGIEAVVKLASAIGARLDRTNAAMELLKGADGSLGEKARADVAKEREGKKADDKKDGKEEDDAEVDQFLFESKSSLLS